MDENIEIIIKYDGDMLKLLQNRSNIELRRYGRSFNPDRVVRKGAHTVDLFVGKYLIPVDLSCYEEHPNKGEVQCLRFLIKPR